MLRTLRYMGDCVRALTPQQGYCISFSGVDGAGKSTLLSATQELLAKHYRKQVVMLRHRPSLLPILSAWKYGKAGAEQRAAKTLPRQGTNRNTITSMLRFGYYYLDYLVGQCYVYLRYLSRGYVVLYDRYYFDFISDPRRSNLQLPPGIARWGYGPVHKPDLNFFLYAPAEAIRKRKQELSLEDIQDLSHSYLALFQDLASKGTRGAYIPLENLVLQDSLSTIQRHIHHTLFPHLESSNHPS